MNPAAVAGDEALARIAGGAMLYDAARVGQPEAAIFEPAYWQARGAAVGTRGGRGTVTFVRGADGEPWVLRHYRRGGAVARLSSDAYLWTGAPRTRSFAEWRLLRQLRDWNLPVPRPIAARYLRRGLTYRADLITEELPTRRTLAASLADAPLPTAAWHAIGRCIARLHARGVHHADLNAHNLLLGDDGAVYVLDFDRGRIRRRGSWERVVLARLRRSLDKVTAKYPPGRFGHEQWRALLTGVEE
ncbi:MAG TPA: 3-deoxy-D-manno-octulosonic acid kinase [Steroidobacteraceae bacterium]|nr:3-deoxy-D-manno-octulosonic acid kinase [Steroidobacteraceae bacterium]